MAYARAVGQFFTWLDGGWISELRHVEPMVIAASVRGPRYSLKRGLTPVLDAEQARQLFDLIDTGTIAGLRDRAMIGVVVNGFARVGALPVR